MLAVIDIGSNSVRLVVFENATRKENFLVELGVNLLIFLGLVTTLFLGLGIASIGGAFSEQIIRYLAWDSTSACWLLCASSLSACSSRRSVSAATRASEVSLKAVWMAFS